ncbi:MAG: hypothetical protein ABDH49_02315 [Candidatus Hydrothermales bacterium]
MPKAAWKIEEIVDIFPKGLNTYVVFEDVGKIVEKLNKNGLIDSLNKKGIINEFLLYLGGSKENKR